MLPSHQTLLATHAMVVFLALIQHVQLILGTKTRGTCSIFNTNCHEESNSLDFGPPSKTNFIYSYSN